MKFEIFSAPPPAVEKDVEGSSEALEGSKESVEKTPAELAVEVSDFIKEYTVNATTTDELLGVFSAAEEKSSEIGLPLPVFSSYQNGELVTQSFSSGTDFQGNLYIEAVKNNDEQTMNHQGNGLPDSFRQRVKELAGGVAEEDGSEAPDESVDNPQEQPSEESSTEIVEAPSEVMEEFSIEVTEVPVEASEDLETEADPSSKESPAAEDASEESVEKTPVEVSDFIGDTESLVEEIAELENVTKGLKGGETVEDEFTPTIESVVYDKEQVNLVTEYLEKGIANVGSLEGLLTVLKAGEEYADSFGGSMSGVYDDQKLTTIPTENLVEKTRKFASVWENGGDEGVFEAGMSLPKFIKDKVIGLAR